MDMLMSQAAYFGLQPDLATTIVAAVHGAVRDWRRVALSAEVGLSGEELEDFAPAFEHGEMDAAGDAAHKAARD